MVAPGMQRVTLLEDITVSDEWNGGRVRLITLLFATMALGMAACTSEQGPTEPPTSPGLAQADAKAYTAVDLGTLAGGFRTYALGINSAAKSWARALCLLARPTPLSGIGAS